MKVRIDKDYCSDPVWVLEEGEQFYINGHLPDLEDILSDDLMKDLESYSELWEDYSWGVYFSENTTTKDTAGSEAFELLAKSLAFRCKAEAPHIQWTYWNPKTKQVVEI